MTACSTFVAQNDTTLYDLMPAVMRHVRTAPPNVVIPELREAYLTFCRRTELLRIVQVIPLQRGVLRYQLCPPTDYQVIRALAVIEGSIPLIIQPNLTACRCGDFFMDGPDWIELLREPYQSDEEYLANQDLDNPAFTLQIQFCVAPTRTSVCIDKLVNDQFRDTIVAGALSRLLLMQDARWFAPQLASKWEMEFKKGLTDGRVTIEKGFSNANMRIDRGGRRLMGWGGLA